MYFPSTPTRVHPSLAVVLFVGNTSLACTDTLKSRQKKMPLVLFSFCLSSLFSLFFIISLSYFFYYFFMEFMVNKAKKQLVKTFSILNSARLVSLFFTLILLLFLKYLLEKCLQVAYTKTVCVISTFRMNST